MSSRYAYNPHGHRAVDTLFETPPADTDIWRYFPLEWFVWLLERRQLFLCRASRLDDEFEGATPVASEQKLMASEVHYTSPEVRAQYRESRRQAREVVAVNCWHIAENESVPMWDRYMRNRKGVAVKSTVRRLGAALPQRTDNGVSSLDDIDISRVRYIDYETGQFPLWNLLYHFIHTRIEYKSENELRVLTTIAPWAIEAPAAGGTDFEVIEAGLLIPVDVEKLIQAIYIAPRAPADVEQTIQDLLQRLGLESIPLRPSSLAAKPIF